MDCYIFGAGPYFGLQKRPAENDYVIAADGGYRWCLQESVKPDLLLGDFDSIDTMPSGVKTEQFPVDKDDTDMMLAVKKGLSNGARMFHLYGGTGGRMDHTLANLQTLIFLAEHKACGLLYAQDAVYTAIKDGSITLKARPSGLLSVFCFGADAQNVTIQGAQYSLQNGTLSAGFPLGVSNHFVGTPVNISVGSGSLVIAFPYEKS
ncbi:MAG: thiamine diphosphokinase [Evtepia sp.]